MRVLLPLAVFASLAVAPRSQAASIAARGTVTAPLLASATDAPRALVFAPTPGTKLARRVELAHELLLTSLAAFNGPGEPQRSTPDLAVTTKFELELGDELLAVSGGRPERLRRVFTKGLLHIELGPRAAAKKALYDVRTPLESNSVLYTWVPEETAWGRYYDGREDLEEHLSGLRQDVDQLAFLPAAPVRVGETWTVPAERLVDVFAPCGRLPYAWPKDLDRAMVRTLSSGVGGGLSEVFGGTAKGGVKAVLARVETRDGAELAIVTLDVDFELAREQNDVLRQHGSLEETQAPTITTHVLWTLRGQGELAWNLTAARAESLRLEGDEKVVARVQFDHAGTMQQVLELAGKLHFAYGAH